MPDNYRLSDEELTLRIEVDLMLKFLDYCSLHHDASIDITITHDNGNKLTAHLYNHAALNQGLTEALQYFISEL